MPKFMLLYANGPTKRPPELTPEELQSRIREYMAWGERIAGKGKMVDGARLSDIWSDPGRAVSVADGKPLVTDGPFVETSEVVGGYAVIEASGYEEAAELCSDHPHIRGGRIIIREVV